MPAYIPLIAAQWTGLEVRPLTHPHRPLHPLTPPPQYIYPNAAIYIYMQVRRLLGCGTFGRVRLVVDKAGGQSYALKGMRKEQARRYSTFDGHTYYGARCRRDDASGYTRLTMAPLTMAPLTMALLTMALLTMALLTMAACA